MDPLTKNIFLNGQTCQKRGWFLRREGKRKAPSEADRFRMLQGIEVGQLAHDVFPDGVVVAPGSREEMVAQTLELIGDTSVPYIFEATFLADDCIAKADVLERCA